MYEGKFIIKFYTLRTSSQSGIVCDMIFKLSWKSHRILFSIKCRIPVLTSLCQIQDPFIKILTLKEVFQRCMNSKFVNGVHICILYLRLLISSANSAWFPCIRAIQTSQIHIRPMPYSLPIKNMEYLFFLLHRCLVPPNVWQGMVRTGRELQCALKPYAGLYQ